MMMNPNLELILKIVVSAGGGENSSRECLLHFVCPILGPSFPIPVQVQVIKGPSQADPLEIIRNRGNRDSSLIPVISIKNLAEYQLTNFPTEIIEEYRVFSSLNA